MKIGDIVRFSDIFVTTDMCQVPDIKVVMIIDGPNEVGNIKVLLPTGETQWIHCSDVEYMQKGKMYLRD